MTFRFDDLPRDRLEDMAAAGAEIEAVYRVLENGGANIVGQMLRDHLGAGGTFFEMDHYPPGDIYDAQTHAQYYYHAHRPEGGEHGHFHTFLRARGMPKGVKPVPYNGKGVCPRGKNALTHFIAISMNREGFPISLFAVNRWVTGESFYAAADVIAMLDRFIIDHVQPCWAANRWLTAMIRLFRPQVEDLLHERDRVIAGRIDAAPDVDVYEDRSLELTGRTVIDVAGQITSVRRALARQGW